jgi:hypothetical protein
MAGVFVFELLSFATLQKKHGFWQDDRGVRAAAAGQERPFD